jgi:hypothetical protein
MLASLDSAEVTGQEFQLDCITNCSAKS